MKNKKNKQDIKSKTINENINPNNWIKEKLFQFKFNKEEVLKLYIEFKKNSQSDCSLESYRKRIGECFKQILIENSSEEYLIKNLAQINSTKQKLQDKNNLINREIRESQRLYNLLEDRNNELIDLLKKVDLNKFNLKEHKIKKENKKYAILNLSDIHAGQNVPEHLNIGNTYNLDVMENRILYYADRVFEEFSLKKITDVLIVLVGDNVTSSRRISEKMSLCSSLMDSSLRVIQVLRQVVILFQQHFNVSVVGVCGNESRSYDDEMSSTTMLVQENYDYMIFNILKMLFQNSPVKFVDSNMREAVFEFGNKTIMVIHGDVLKSKSDFDSKIKDLINRQLEINNKKIDYVITGHFHEVMIANFYCITGTIMGADHWSGLDCLYLNKAAQTYGFIENGAIEFRRIELQHIK